MQLGQNKVKDHLLGKRCYKLQLRLPTQKEGEAPGLRAALLAPPWLAQEGRLLVAQLGLQGAVWCLRGVGAAGVHFMAEPGRQQQYMSAQNKGTEHQ